MFVDLEKADDRVPRKELCYYMCVWVWFRIYKDSMCRGDDGRFLSGDRITSRIGFEHSYLHW